MGRAYYEEENYSEALKMFQRCLELVPKSAIDEMNAGIVLASLGRYDEARQHLERGEKLDPSLAPYASYNRAIAFKREKRFKEAAEEFEKMRALDSTCPDTAYNLAVVYESLGEIEKAFGELSRAVELAPDEIGPHYRRMIIAMRLGKKEIAVAERTIFTELRAVDSRTRTPEELERSVYTEIIEAEKWQPEPVATVTKNPLGVTFEDATATMGLPSREGAGSFPRKPIHSGDIDGDNRPDLLLLRTSGSPLKVWRNRGKDGFVEVSGRLGLSKEVLSQSTAIACGDLDHDGDNDLCVAEEKSIRVFLNQGGEKFLETEGKTVAAEGGAAHELLLVDFDHDGDLDVYAAFPSAPARMYRNNGKAGFEVVPDEAGLSGDGTPVTLVSFVDFDEDNDTDFFLTHSGSASQLLSSMRMRKFQDVASRIGVAEPANPRDAAIADINNDGWPDIVLLLENGEVVALTGKRLGKLQRSLIGKTEGAGRALAFLDYDNDGDEDLFAAGRLFQNDTAFTDVTAEVGLHLERSGGLVQAVAEDFDLDGDWDVALCWEDGRLALLRNQGGNRNNWIRASLEGLQSNRFGAATKVEVRDGDFFQRKICMGQPLLFGLGERKALDVLRLWWPTGVAQNILSPKVGEIVEVREKLGPPSSCPFVYVWDGKRFSFLTDALDGAALGVPLGDGNFLSYRSKEDILIPGSRIQAKDGRLAIQLTGELRELVYLDRATLTVVDSASHCAVYPDECVGPPATEETRLYCVTDLCPPACARDDRGKDATRVVSELDGRYADGFGLTRFHGLAETHTLTLDFNSTPAMNQPALVLSGWIEWIDGDTLYALGQGAGPAPLGPVLEIERVDSDWQKLSDNIGVPAGIGKTVVVELPRGLCRDRTRLRITTNLQVYWDRIAIGDAGASKPVRRQELELVEADLRFRGFSEIVRSEESKPPSYNYDKVSLAAPWQPQQGLLTRFGDVLGLLAGADDRLVVFGPGDELALTFSAPPELALGQKRDFVLRLDGWIKDANPSTFAGDRVEPLPYRGMKGYPLGAEEGLMDDPSHAEYLSLYNTRALRRDVARFHGTGDEGI